MVPLGRRLDRVPRMADQEPNREVPLIWVGLDELPVLMTNQFICQFVGREEFVLSLGQAVGPPMLGSEADVQRQLRELTHVAVKPIVRVSLTEIELRELAGAIAANLKQYEERVGGMKGDR